ncbi:MAG: tetratricopeptide repeat protein, partial [Longimicrobiaceae bacterium]
AERMRKAGKLDASFAALKEFADLAPAPADVRRLLADQLLAHGKVNEGVEQLRLLLGLALESGDGPQAEELRRQIVAADPHASTEPLVPQRAAAAPEELALETGEYHPPPPGAPVASRAGAPPDVFGSDPADFGNVQLDVAPLEGLETTSLGDAAAAPPAGRAAPPAGDEETEGAAELPFIDFDAAPAPSRPAADPSRFGEVSLDEGRVDFAPGVGDDEAEPLPLIDFDAPPAPPARPAAAAPPPLRDRLEELRERVASVPEDAAAREALIASLHDHGLGHEVPGLLDELHRALAKRGMYREAVDPISALIRLRPGDPMLLQKRVEYAFRSGDREEQVVAYLALGRHFSAAGEAEKAEAVYRRVLELDPGNQEALTAVAARPAARPAAGAPARSAPARPAPPAAGEYVDLAALVLGDDDGREASTRFVVEEREPSGDEDRDFAEMLAHFRQKVAENIEVEDSTSHYDLGLAFKEMGLIDEAIAEFQVALRGGANPLATLELLGQCFVERAQYAVAERVLERALRLPGVSEVDLVGVLYHLARAEEALGRPREAMEHYERVLSVDIRFRDTARRIEALRAASGAAPL